MRKAINKERIEGRLYDISQLALKTVQNSESKHFGEEFIGGSIDIATDDDCLNIVTVHFAFVQATYKSGKANSTFGVLKNLIENGKTVLVDGKEEASMVRVDATLALNDFYTQRNGEEVLVSAKSNNGSFVNIVSKLADEDARNTFEYDMLINGTRYVEADEERNIKEDFLVVKGAVFDFRNSILPVELVVHNKGGIKYFESLDASPKNLVFTKVWGKINSGTIVDRREEESAFGEPAIKEYSKTIREWVITGTSKPDAVYEIGDEQNGITEEEIKKAMADREVYLAGVKKRADEYQASRNSGNAGTSNVAAAPAAQGGFAF